ncbi:hypothetical protein [Streptomyces sp. NPDC058953]|uniref:hypothetical protein n=1 Tax=unclassified Streptomyces TaxID=2593676 RepID=UPI003686BEF2
MVLNFRAAVLRSYEGRSAVEDIRLTAGPAEDELLVRIAPPSPARVKGRGPYRIAAAEPVRV